MEKSGLFGIWELLGLSASQSRLCGPHKMVFVLDVSSIEEKKRILVMPLS